MGIADQSGYDAIQIPIPQAPYAFRKLVRGPDGTTQVVYVDQQGNTVNSLQGYDIVEAGNNSYFQEPTQNISVTKDKQEHERSTAQSVIRETTRGEKSDSPGSGNYGRSQANNFGYIDKPGFMGIASAIPGPAGMIGKVANTAMNANNVAAVNAARTSMGLPGVGIGGAVLGAVKDNKGKVADVSIGGSTYSTPVGLEAMSPEGMTNMTPQEASLRSAANVRAGKPAMTLSPEADIAARDAAFEAEFDKPGLMSRMTKVATNFLDDMFGTPSATPSYDYTAGAKISSQNSGKSFNPTDQGFSDMISGTSGNRTNNNSGTRGEKSGSGSASNPGTSGNMGSGAGTTSGHGPGIGSA